MENDKTVCPRHATIVEREQDGTLIWGCDCRWGRSGAVERMFDEGAYWAAGDSVVVDDDVLEQLYQRFVMLVRRSLWDTDGVEHVWAAPLAPGMVGRTA
jgi:hypothetical protein